MKVVAYGEIRPKEIRCAECRAILEYLPPDIISDFIGNDKIIHFIECPICHTKMRVPIWRGVV